MKKYTLPIDISCKIQPPTAITYLTALVSNLGITGSLIYLQHLVDVEENENEAESNNLYKVYAAVNDNEKCEALLIIEVFQPTDIRKLWQEEAMGGKLPTKYLSHTACNVTITKKTSP